MCFSFYTQTVVSSTWALNWTIFKSGVVKKRRFTYVVFWKCFDKLCRVISYFRWNVRRFPCIAEVSKTGRNVLRRFVIVQLVYVKRLCSLTFIWHVFCMSQWSTTFRNQAFQMQFFFYISCMWPFLCKAKSMKFIFVIGRVCITFTFTRLADTIIQSDLHCILYISAFWTILFIYTDLQRPMMGNY